MLNVSRPSCVWSLLLCVLAVLAGESAKAQTPTTGLDRQLNRVDLAVSGVGEFNMSSTGTVIVDTVPTTLTQSPGNTLGALVTLRYTKSPKVAFEANYGYARYTQNYSTIQGVQQNASEYTIGYVAHTPNWFDLHPFVGVGGGAIVFRPTPGGGQGLPAQGRGAFYYSLGAEKMVFSSPHFGVRLQFRQIFFSAPDFGQNYLTINKYTSTLEPGFGIFWRF